MFLEKFLVAILILSIFELALASQFSNVVVYPPKKDVYKFHLEVEHGLAMGVWKENRQIFEPIYEISNGTFVKKSASFWDECGTEYPILEDQSNDLLTVAGKHRNLILINRKLPGEPIVVHKDSMVEITVTNHLHNEGLSIHWHGQVQKDSFWMDGVSRITQCPINPGESYTYKFKATDAGTHWYHSHTGVQRSEGAYGPFIVTEYHDNSVKPEEDTYDKEFYFIMTEFLQEDSNSVQHHASWEIPARFHGYDDKECFFPNRQDDGTPLPQILIRRGLDAIIVNGKGYYNLPEKIEELEEKFDKNVLKYLEKFEVEPNKRYLFRVIGANAGHPLEIRVGGHKMTVIASDGNKIKTDNTKEVDALIVNSGERYDFYIHTKATAEKNFFIVVRTLDAWDLFDVPLNETHYGVAVLEYKKDADEIPTCDHACRECTKLNNCKKVNCPFWPREDEGKYHCVPSGLFKSLSVKEKDIDLFKSQYDSEEFEEYFMNFHYFGKPWQRTSLHGRQFLLPKAVPFLKKNPKEAMIECPKVCTYEKMCQCTNTLQIKKNKIIQFTFFNMGVDAARDGTAHPIHLHGHHFYIMAMGFGIYNQSTNMFRRGATQVHCPDLLKDEACTDAEWLDPNWKNGNISSFEFANMIDPPMKDTVIIPVGGYVVVRFRSDNIGYWFLHCHIETHSAMGMGIIIQEGTHDEIVKSVNFDEVNVCGKGNENSVNFILPNGSVSSKFMKLQGKILLITLLGIIFNFHSS